MNRIFLIGNLCRDPELRTTPNGIAVATFTVAVNRRKQEAGQPEADFFRVTAWRQLGENCARYLAKGRKVAVVGPVRVQTYQANDGTTRASLEVTAEDVEFLTPRGEAEPAKTLDDDRGFVKVEAKSGFVEIDPGDDLPF